MPFDGAGFAADQPLQKLDAVIDLLATPRRWCKGVLKTRNGQYCIRGALMEVDALDALQPIVMQAIHDVAGRRFRRIEHFNDHPNTDHEQVLAVLDRARERIAAGVPATAAHPATSRLRWWREALGGGAGFRGWLFP
jgi:hypothetical protein